MSKEINFEDLKLFFSAEYEQRLNDTYEKIFSSINKKKDSLKLKVEQISELEYEKSLIEGDIINYIKTEINRSDFNLFAYTTSNTLWKAWKYFYILKGNKQDTLSSDDKKSYSEAYEYTVHIIRRYFNLNEKDYSLKEISDYNFSQAYEFLFEYKNPDSHKIIEFEIRVPVFAAANPDNYTNIIRGYQIYWKDSPNGYTHISSNLDYREVAKNLHDFLESKSAEFLHADNINFIVSKEANQDEVHN